MSHVHLLLLPPSESIRILRTEKVGFIPAVVFLHGGFPMSGELGRGGEVTSMQEEVSTAYLSTTNLLEWTKYIEMTILFKLRKLGFCTLITANSASQQKSTKNGIIPRQTPRLQKPTVQGK